VISTSKVQNLVFFSLGFKGVGVWLVRRGRGLLGAINQQLIILEASLSLSLSPTALETLILILA